MRVDPAANAEGEDVADRRHADRFAVEIGAGFDRTLGLHEESDARRRGYVVFAGRREPDERHAARVRDA